MMMVIPLNKIVSKTLTNFYYNAFGLGKTLKV